MNKLSFVLYTNMAAMQTTYYVTPMAGLQTRPCTCHALQTAPVVANVLNRYLVLTTQQNSVSRFLMDDPAVNFSAGWIVLETDQPSPLISNFLSLCTSYLFIRGFSPLSFCKFCLSTSPQTCTVSSKRRRTKQRFA